MTITLERPIETPDRASWASTVQRLVYESPLWLLAAAVIAVSVVIHGYGLTGAIPPIARIAADPFNLDPTITEPWLYQSPVGPLLAWAVGLTTADGVGLVHFAVTIVSVVGCAYAVRRWASDFAARLFLLAFFCSPNSRAAVSFLGIFDIITLAGLTVTMVSTAGPAFAVGLLLGFNHFEIAATGAVAVAAVRLLIRHEDRRPVVALAGGLITGKVALVVYLVWFDLPVSGRLSFVQEQGIADIVGGWIGHVPVMMWAIFNVLWVGVFWMLRDMRRRDRLIIAGTFAAISVAPLMTYAMSRVYRNVTWPLVMLLVLYAAEHRDRALVQRGALLLAVAAIFVPRTELWHGGLMI